MELPTSTSTTPDRPGRALVQRVQAGDDRAFAELVSQHDVRLRALALRLLGDRDRVDDALQEAYLKAFRCIGGFRQEADVATWLYRITYNACLDDLRRRRETVVPEEIEAPSPGSGPAELAVTRLEVADLLDRLAPEVRAAVVLVHGYGFGHGEASVALGVPVGTIASRLHRAGKRLRRARRWAEGTVADAA